MTETTVKAGWLIDGTGAAPQADVLLCLEQGMIRAVEPVRGRNLEEDQVLDLSGFTVMPALIDAHTHLAFATNGPAPDREAAQAAIASHAAAYLAGGVGAVRDGGDCHGWTLAAVSTCLDKGLPLTIRPALSAWHRAGRYGRLIAKALAAADPLPAAIQGQGPGHVKIIQSGINSLTVLGGQTQPQFNVAELTAAVKAAHGLGLKVMVHANGEIPVAIAVAAGCDSIEHGYFMGRDNLAAMAERQVAWVPTLAPMAAFTRMDELAPQRRDVARRTLDHQLEQLALARRLGVAVALGTDAGSPGVGHGTGVVAELEWFLQAGFTLAEAIHCATARGAELLDLPERGVLAPGRQTTFTAVVGPPAGLPGALLNNPRLYLLGKAV